MYKGLTSKIYEISKWDEVINRGSGWQFSNGWAIASHQICERHLKIRLN
jgi:hypothetical protein